MNSKKGFAYFCRIPLWIYMLLVITFPMLYALNISFRKFSFALPGYDGQFIGLENYLRVFTDAQFWNSLRITLIIIAITIPLQLVFGFLIASLLFKGLKGTRIITSVILLPMTIAPIVVGLMSRLLLMDRFGLISYYLERLGIYADKSILGTPFASLCAIILMDVWHWTSFMALIMLAGLQALPQEPYEAIKIDGGSKFQTTIYITLPLLLPIILTSVLLRIIDLFRIFDEILVLTGGGPGTGTESIEMFTYKVNFHNWDMGYGASVGIITFLIVLAGSLSVLGLLQRKTD